MTHDLYEHYVSLLGNPDDRIPEAHVLQLSTADHTQLSITFEQYVIHDGALVISTESAADEVYAWWWPVFDRVQADCVYGNPKGCVDARLLCRLSADCEFLAKKLHDAHELSITNDMSVHTAWWRDMYIYYTQLNEIYRHVKDLYDTGYVLDTTVMPIDVAGNQPVTFETINAWERTLYDCYRLFYGMQDMRLVLGTFSAGTNRLRQSIRR